MHPDYKRFLKENPDRVRGNPDDGAMFASLLRRLRAMPEPEAREDFASRVLDRVRREEAAAATARRRRSLRWAVRVAAAAAVAFLCASAFRVWLAPAADPAAIAMARTAAACDFIAAGQDTDGVWRAAGPAQDGALTAIALLALMRNEADPLHGPHAAAVRNGVDSLVAMQSDPRGLGDGATRAGRSSRYLVAMALRSGAGLPGAPAAWRDAAARAALDAPSAAEAVRLNRLLAHPAAMPETWKRAGGPVLAASLDLLRPRAL